jgi:hypothetical protein
MPPPTWAEPVTEPAAARPPLPALPALIPPLPPVPPPSAPPIPPLWADAPPGTRTAAPSSAVRARVIVVLRCMLFLLRLASIHTRIQVVPTLTRTQTAGHAFRNRSPSQITNSSFSDIEVSFDTLRDSSGREPPASRPAFPARARPSRVRVSLIGIPNESQFRALVLGASLRANGSAQSAPRLAPCNDMLLGCAPQALKYAIWCVVASRRPCGDQSSPVWSP